MQRSYPPTFTRDYGCTEAEWLRWLPQAMGEGEIVRTRGQAEQRWTAHPDALLLLQWRELPPRVIALVRLPRLEVRFSFTGLPDDERHRYMVRFDQHLQRGGG
jgi:hypothetical protein